MNRSRPAARRRTTALPGAHHGLGSVIALAGTGRLDELSRVLRHGRPVVDRYGYVEYRVGLKKFMDHLHAVLPLWWRYST